MGLLDKFRRGLKKTSQLLKTDLRDLLKHEGDLVDDVFLDRLMEVLIHTDMGPKSAREIVSHMSSVLAYAYGRLSDTKRIRHELADWNTELDRFYGKLKSIDDAIAKGAALNEGELDQLLQGPFADVLTHIGQLAMLRRMCGTPVPGENYFLADIEIGRAGIEQPDPAVPDPTTEK